MSDAIARAAKRKVALDAARRALKSGSRAELESALKGLPPDGRKAGRLGQQLQEALAISTATDTSKIKSAGSRAVCSSDGLKYEFRFEETGDISLFHPRRSGSQVAVVINTAHPFGRELLDTERWQDPAILTLFAAWAHYELDQSDERLQGAVRDARIDWGRIVRRLLASDSGFRFD
jgi:hypothetical protein